jgi:hypothetical protein
MKRLMILGLVIFCISYHNSEVYTQGSNNELQKEVAEKLPVLKEGDNVYLSVSMSRERGLYLNPDNAGRWLTPDKRGDILITYANDTLRIADTSKKRQQPIGLVNIPAKILLDEIRKCVNENPNDSKKWSVTTASVTFKFNGIQRLFYLRTIETPLESSHRKHGKYGNGHAPGFRVRIDKNGEYIGYIQSSNKSWNTDFPQSENNIIEMREGCDDRLLLRLRDWNTIFTEHPIVDFVDVRYENLIKGVVLENLAGYAGPASAIKLEFQQLKP